MINDLATDLATVACERLGWGSEKALNGLRIRISGLLAKAEGREIRVYTTMRAHLATAPEGRVRETVAMVLNEYSGLLALFK